MALSDADFVRFMNREFLHRLPEDFAARLYALALRGAETQWRPIEGAPKGTPQRRIEVILLDEMGWCHVGFWGTGYCAGRDDTETPQWRITWDNDPLDDATHFIPLSALGEPKDE